MYGNQQEMAEMGIEIKKILILWGDSPSATNLLFSNMKKSGIDLLAKGLRDEVVAARFSDVTWFSIWLTLKDLLDLKPSFDTLMIFKITCQSLIENKAHDVGANWQIWFAWTDEQWKQIGFDRNKYNADVKSDVHCTPEARKRRLQWGPKSD